MGFQFPFFKKKSHPENYIGLYVSDASLWGFIFTIEDKKPIIIAQSNYRLTSGFDNILEDADNLISELEQISHAVFSKTVFFLHSWMIDGENFEIKEPYKSILKSVSKELELDPLGYIDCKEALLKYFKGQSIVNVIALELNKTKLGVSVIKGGSLVQSVYVARTEELGEDLNSVLSNFPKDSMLPTLVVLYGTENNDEASSVLTGFDWEEKIFSQHPTIQILKQDVLNQAFADSFCDESVSQTDEAELVTKTQEVVPPHEENSFGFVIGKDVLDDSSIQKPSNIQQRQIQPRDNFFSSTKVRMHTFFSSVSGMFHSSKIETAPGHRSPKVILTFVGFMVLAGGLFMYEYFFHTVRIKVFLQTRLVDDTFELTLPIVKGKSEVLAAVEKSTEKEYTNKKQTTGVKDVGEKAKGTVTIHNFDNAERTFTKGTNITKGNLIYSINTDITVDPSSGATSEGIKQSGKKSVSVTAEKIGPEYNVAKNSQFSIGSLPSSLYLAIADDNFTGGSKEEVKTISNNDINTLTTEAKKQLVKNAPSVLGDHIQKDEILISELTSAKLDDPSFSGEVGEESDSISVKAKSKIDFFTISESALREELKNLFSKKIDAGYLVDEKDIEYTLGDVEKVKNEVQLTVESKASAHRDIEIEKVRSFSRMKASSSLPEKLKKQYEFTNVEIEYQNRLFPFLNSWTPLFSKNIQVITSLQ